MRKADIYYNEHLAGRLEETDTGYWFAYDKTYLQSVDARPISLTMPLTDQPYDSNILHPFFDGLIPEGWLLDVALRNSDVSSLDRMGLLLLCCKECLGAVSVVDTSD
ncbi:MAG: HipA N-terminal domain-containing protein [Paludibacteraceae bacterium]|nr:HipA N-terminal domain-containing protein [Paludibacteraceae bacterium]